MKLAIMQPYFFPYLGYFQLLSAVDEFVFLDDVTFIKQGWINRNRILVDGQPAYFSLPVHGSSNHPINEIGLDLERFAHWKRKFLATLRHNYSRAANFAAVHELVAGVIETPARSIAEMAIRSVRASADYLGVTTPTRRSSTRHQSVSGQGVQRVLGICRDRGATVYVNSQGGRALYQPDDFAGQGIDLRFLIPAAICQNGPVGTPPLSIIDVIAKHSRSAIQRALDRYQLTR
ncbi:MAG: WbqC family protein [Xanthomonadales bacterium]|nr:WbqC family protein [Xanthomonadales bacterium]